jgi:uncharacterized delta-60 repeat protein
MRDRSASQRAAAVALVGALLGAVLVVVTAPPAAAATTIHVPADQPTITAALAAAVDGDTIEVAPGTYAENLRFEGKDVRLVATDGPGATVLDGGGAMVVHVGPGGSVEGFTITGGASTPLTSAGSVLEGDAVMTGNRFVNNSHGSADFGAALYMFDGPGTVTNNVFTGNTCAGGFSTSASVVMADFHASPLIANNLFIDNPCPVDLLLDQAGAPQVINNTFVSNGQGVGIHVGLDPDTGAIIRNNIVTGQAVGVRFEQSTVQGFDHNLVGANVADYQGAASQTGTNGNISGDPLLLDGAGGDLRLQATSPAVDAGSDLGAPATDFDGTGRPLDGPDADTDAEFDIGAHERDGSEPPPVPQTGILDWRWSGDGLSAFPSRYDIALGPYGSGGLFTASYKATDGNGPMRITKFDGNGAPVPGFGPTGFVLRAFAPGAGVSFPTHIVPVGLRHTIVGEHYGSRARLGVARLRSDGSYDPAFSGDGRALYKVFGLEHDIVSAFRAEVLTGGKIGLAVIALDYDGGGQLQLTGQAMMRLNANGSLDTTFSGDGILPLTLATSDVRFLPNGAAFAGLQRPTSHLVRKLTPAGAYDTSFSGDGIASAACGSHRGANMAIDTAGRPLLMCVRDTDPTLTLAIYRFTPSGAFDTTYSGDAKTNLVLHGDTDDVRLHFDATGRPWAAIASGANPADFDVYTLDATGNPDPAWSSDGIANLHLPFTVDLAGLARATSRLFVTTYRDATNIAIVALKVS